MEIEVFGNAAREINYFHAEILSHAQTSLQSAVRIGELLSRVREASKHREFLPWLKANVLFSQRTAYNYMECFRRRDELATLANFGEGWSRALMSSGNGEVTRTPQQLHESNFYSQSIRLTQRLMGDINHELKDRPIDSWGKENWITLAAALEPIAELYARLKSLLA